MFQKLSNRLKSLLELNAFGVCNSLGEKMGLKSATIRLFFIYISFLGLGSPILIYLALAFIKDLRLYIRKKRRNPIWDF